MNEKWITEEGLFCSSISVFGNNDTKWKSLSVQQLRVYYK